MSSVRPGPRLMSTPGFCSTRTPPVSTIDVPTVPSSGAQPGEIVPSSNSSTTPAPKVFPTASKRSTVARKTVCEARAGGASRMAASAAITRQASCMRADMVPPPLAIGLPCQAIFISLAQLAQERARAVLRPGLGPSDPGPVRAGLEVSPAPAALQQMKMQEGCAAKVEDGAALLDHPGPVAQLVEAPMEVVEQLGRAVRHRFAPP